MRNRGKRKGQRGRVKSSSFFSFFSLLCSVAFAHQPLWNEASSTIGQAFNIENVSVSKAIFGNMQKGEVDYFLLAISEPLSIELSLFVGGQCDEAFQPKLYLLSFIDESSTRVPFAVPDGYSVLQGQGPWRPYRGHGLIGREGPGLKLNLSPGSHYVVVEAGSQDGFYLLSLSGSEAFGGSAEGREAIPRFNACK